MGRSVTLWEETRRVIARVLARALDDDRSDNRVRALLSAKYWLQDWLDDWLVNPAAPPLHGSLCDGRGAWVLMDGPLRVRPRKGTAALIEQGWLRGQARAARAARLAALAEVAAAARKPTLAEQLAAMPVALPELNVKAMLKQCEPRWLRNHIRHVHSRVGGKSYDQHILALSGRGLEGQAAIAALREQVNLAIGKRWHALREDGGTSGRHASP
jgi:hypothetical protein